MNAEVETFATDRDFQNKTSTLNAFVKFSLKDTLKDFTL